MMHGQKNVKLGNVKVCLDVAIVETAEPISVRCRAVCLYSKTASEFSFGLIICNIYCMTIQ